MGNTPKAQNLLEKINSTQRDWIVSSCLRLGSGLMPIVILAEFGIPVLIVPVVILTLSLAVIMIFRAIYVSIKKCPRPNPHADLIVTEFLTLPYASLLMGLIVLENGLDLDEAVGCFGLAIMTAIPLLFKIRR